jgi:hypothetical protein
MEEGAAAFVSAGVANWLRMAAQAGMEYARVGRMSAQPFRDRKRISIDEVHQRIRGGLNSSESAFAFVRSRGAGV